jgi:hypothetical protein
VPAYGAAGEQPAGGGFDAIDVNGP